MEFLKKHYEKLILLVLLLAFIISMVYVFSIINQTREIKESDLNIPTRQADYEPADPADVQFDLKTQLAATQLHWEPSTVRNPKNAEHFSDLVVAFPMSRCPHCSKIIPRVYMADDSKCPFALCGKELRTPPKRKPQPTYVITGSDSDGDGISNQDESRFGLNPNDPLDARQDKDRDGFSNVYECRMDTSPINAKSHPPLWYRLKLIDLRTIKIPYKLMAITTNNSNKKTEWMIQINSTDKGEKTSFCFLDDTLRIGEKQYVIKDVDLRQKTVSPDNGGTPQILDESIIKLELKGGDEKIEMQTGRDVYSPDRKAIMLDTMDGREYIYDVGQAFTMGNNRTGKVTYRIVSIQPEAMTVNLEMPKKYDGDKKLDERGTQMVVTKEGMIPEDALIDLTEEEESAELALPGTGRSR